MVTYSFTPCPVIMKGGFSVRNFTKRYNKIIKRENIREDKFRSVKFLRCYTLLRKNL